jgi:deoxyribodipyrimidine photo-lyase
MHQPWAAPAGVLHDAAVTLGTSYPEPVVDLADSRKTALSAWDRIRNRA